MQGVILGGKEAQRYRWTSNRWEVYNFSIEEPGVRNLNFSCAEKNTEDSRRMKRIIKGIVGKSVTSAQTGDEASPERVFVIANDDRKLP